MNSWLVDALGWTFVIVFLVIRERYLEKKFISWLRAENKAASKRFEEAVKVAFNGFDKYFAQKEADLQTKLQIGNELFNRMSVVVCGTPLVVIPLYDRLGNYLIVVFCKGQKSFDMGNGIFISGQPVVVASVAWGSHGILFAAKEYDVKGGIVEDLSFKNSLLLTEFVEMVARQRAVHSP